MTVDFLPSEVLLIVPPLVGTLGRAESEFAAALIVRACHELGDRWQPIQWTQIQAVLKSDLEAAREPFASLVRNPFFRPNVHELVASGFATGDPSSGGAVALTDDAIERLRRWVRAKSSDEPTAAEATAEIPETKRATLGPGMGPTVPEAGNGTVGPGRGAPGDDHDG